MEKIGTIDILNSPLEIEVFAHRLSAAVSTIPDTKGWLDGAALLLLFAIIALPIGFQSKFIQLEMVRVSWQNAIAITILSLFMPATSEELVFRGLLLPRTTENLSVAEIWFWGCLSLILFIIYHPLNALTFFPRGRQTFFHPIFLTLAGLLGIVCTLAYLQSGCLWIPVIIHWLIVVVWLLLLGGYGKLYD